jgi:hypothetical protein
VEEGHHRAAHHPAQGPPQAARARVAARAPRATGAPASSSRCTTASPAATRSTPSPATRSPSPTSRSSSTPRTARSARPARPSSAAGSPSPGNYYEARDLGKGDVSRIDPEVVKFLNRAADIGMVMFVSEELRVDFDVVLVCNPQVSRVEFKVAGELREFTCDDKQLPRLRWPSKEGQGASLMVRGRQTKKNLDEQGEWGLFKLLEKWSKLPDGAGDVLDFKFDLTPVRPRLARGPPQADPQPRRHRLLRPVQRRPQVPQPRPRQQRAPPEAPVHQPRGLQLSGDRDPRRPARRARPAAPATRS